MCYLSDGKHDVYCTFNTEHDFPAHRVEVYLDHSCLVFIMIFIKKGGNGFLKMSYKLFLRLDPPTTYSRK